MPSGVKIKREFISRFTGLRFTESNFCYDSCMPQCENNFCGLRHVLWPYFRNDF